MPRKRAKASDDRAAGSAHKDGMDILEIRRRAKAKQKDPAPVAAAQAPAPLPPPPPADRPLATAVRTPGAAEMNPVRTPDVTDDLLLDEFFASSRDAAIDRFTDPAFLLSVQSYIRADPGRTRYLACRVGSEEYGIDLLYTREILKPVSITPVPRAPRDVIGVISVRGAVLPVIDLALRLGASAPAGGGRDERFICLEYQGEGLCVRVDAVSHVVGFGASDIEPPPGGLRGIATEYIVGIGRLDERMIILLNVDEVIGGLFKRVW